MADRTQGSGSKTAAKKDGQDSVDEKVETAVKENRQDVFVVAGDQARDGVEHDDHAGPFSFDTEAKTTRVDHFAVASNASELRIELDGKYFSFGVQEAVALHRLISAGVIALNY